MKHKNWKRVLAGVLMTGALVGILAGCGPSDGPSTDEPNAEVLAAQQAAEDERKQWEDKIRPMDALADCGEFQPVENLVKTYLDVSTEEFEDMVAYEAPGVEEKGTGPAYIFIGKLNKEADEKAAAEVSSQLSEVGATFEGAEEESMTARSGMFVIMAAGSNDAIICEKFTQVMALNSPTTCEEVFNGLSQDLTKVKAAD